MGQSKSIYVESESTLTETEYEKMLETLIVDNLERFEPVNVITDETMIDECVKQDTH